METKSSASTTEGVKERRGERVNVLDADSVTPSPLHPLTPSVFSAAWAILLKDLRAECRTRTAISAVMMFAVTTVTVISFSIVGNLKNDAQAAMLWVVIFFSAMSGLARAFVHEEEGRTADALRLSASAEAVYLGKCAFNLALLIALEIIIVPMFIAFLSVKVSNLPLLLAVLLLGDVGLVAVSTILAAMVAKARTAGGALFAVICLPILLFLLKAAVTATTFAFKSESLPAVADVGRTQFALLAALAAFAVVFVTVSLMLFEYVWKE
jgi:heme exporter protein B